MQQKTFLLFLFLWIAARGNAQRNLISNALKNTPSSGWYKDAALQKMFPVAANRKAWESVDKNATAYLLNNGEKYLGYIWLAIPAGAALDYSATGKRAVYEQLFYARREALSSLVMAECIEGKGRFISDIVNGIWAICEDSYWGLVAHLYLQKKGDGLPDVTEPTVDFAVAETATLLAWTHSLLGPELDSISPELSLRIKYEVDRRLLEPLRTRNDFWYLGFGERIPNNWNPWVICNWMVASMLLDDNTQRREADLLKMGVCLDAFLNHYPEDGGCDEGPGYWDRAGGALFDCLEVLYTASNGKVNLFQQSLVKKIGSYLHTAWIADDYFLNFADASAKVKYNPMLVYRFGVRTDNPVLAAMGAKAADPQALDKGRIRGTLYRQLEALFNLPAILKADTIVSYVREFTLPDLQLAGARRGSFYYTAKGGHNDESHNHNDVGNFMLYYKDRPLLIDVGVEYYTAKTFSPQRYEIWTMQSQYHNMPYINGVAQKEGRDFKAENFRVSHNNSQGSTVEIDITKAYPVTAGVEQWKRTYSLQGNGKKFIIKDAFRLNSRKDSTWSTILVTEKPRIEPGCVVLETNGDKIKMRYDASMIKPLIEEIAVTDAKLTPIWGSKIYRIKMLLISPGRTGKIVLTIEG